MDADVVDSFDACASLLDAIDDSIDFFVVGTTSNTRRNASISAATFVVDSYLSASKKFRNFKHSVRPTSEDADP